MLLNLILDCLTELQNVTNVDNCLHFKEYGSLCI